VKQNITDLFPLDNLIVEPKACMNHLNRKTVCQDCVEACPVDAIYLDNKIPVIDQSSCINCGACIGQCPTLAIDHIQKPYFHTSQKIVTHSDANITCDQYEKYQKGVKVPCYLYLDLPLLLLYGREKETLTFYAGKCKTCPKAALVSVENHFEKLQKELDHYQIPITIQFSETELDDTQDQTVDGLTRRELFKKFSMKNVREALLKKGEKTGETKERSLTLKERVGWKRKLFNRHIQKNGEKKEVVFSSAHFLNIEVLDTCSGCNVCEQVCPTNAIHWEDKEGKSQLIFDLQNCIGCQKCASCPEDAIRFHTVTLDQYLSQETKKMKTFQLKECIQCGDMFRTSQDTDTCPFCEAQKNNDPMQFFAHKLG